MTLKQLLQDWSELANRGQAFNDVALALLLQSAHKVQLYSEEFRAEGTSGSHVPRGDKCLRALRKIREQLRNRQLEEDVALPLIWRELHAAGQVQFNVMQRALKRRNCVKVEVSACGPQVLRTVGVALAEAKQRVAAGFARRPCGLMSGVIRRVPVTVARGLCGILIRAVTKGLAWASQAMVESMKSAETDILLRDGLGIVAESVIRTCLNMSVQASAGRWGQFFAAKIQRREASLVTSADLRDAVQRHLMGSCASLIQRLSITGTDLTADAQIAVAILDALAVIASDGAVESARALHATGRAEWREMLLDAAALLMLAVVNVWSTVAACGGAIARTKGKDGGTIAGVTWGSPQDARLAMLSLLRFVAPGIVSRADLGAVLCWWLSPELTGAILRASPIQAPTNVMLMMPARIGAEVERLLCLSSQLNEAVTPGGASQTRRSVSLLARASAMWSQLQE